MQKNTHKPGFGPNSYWIVDRGGDLVEKKAAHGARSLQPLELLIYFLWIADSCRRGDGDIEQGDSYYPGFKNEAARLASDLGCRLTEQCFRLPDEKFVSQYYDFFDEICDELKRLLPGGET